MNPSVTSNETEYNSSASPEPLIFSLAVPFDAAYITIARLVVAGIANHASLSIDEIEDIKIAVGEAFNFYFNNATTEQAPTMTVYATLSDNNLNIRVCVDGLFLNDKWDLQSQRDTSSPKEISSLTILNHLVDGIDFIETEVGSEIRLTKELKS